MGFSLGAVLPAIGAIAGGIFGGAPGAAAGGSAGAGVGSMLGQGDANQANSAEAQYNRLWQEKMSNTAHQRQVADLRSAGLNPILSANSGAAVGSGATATHQNELAALPGAVSSAADSIRMKRENEQAKAQIEQADSSTKLNMEMARTQAQQQKLIQNNATVAEKEARQMDAQFKAIEQRSKADYKRAKYDEMGAEYDAIMDRANKGLDAASSAASVLRGGKWTDRFGGGISGGLSNKEIREYRMRLKGMRKGQLGEPVNE